MWVEFAVTTLAGSYFLASIGLIIFIPKVVEVFSYGNAIGSFEFDH
jgi:hypothetical protein